MSSLHLYQPLPDFTSDSIYLQVLNAITSFMEPHNYKNSDLWGGGKLLWIKVKPYFHFLATYLKRLLIVNIWFSDKECVPTSYHCFHSTSNARQMLSLGRCWVLCYDVLLLRAVLTHLFMTQYLSSISQLFLSFPGPTIKLRSSLLWLI